jgi:hypothetical protein
MHRLQRIWLSKVTIEMMVLLLELGLSECVVVSISSPRFPHVYAEELLLPKTDNPFGRKY